MLRGRTLFWTIIGSVAAAAVAVAVVIALIQVNSGAPPKAASSPAHPISARSSSHAGKAAPVVIPRTSGSLAYISDLTPSGNLGELIYPGPVKIYGSIYPKSISFYCDDGDLPAFPAVYKLQRGAHRFEGTVGVEAKWPAHYQVGVSLVGDGRTLQTFNVSVLKPKTVDVNVTGVHSLTLECFSPGMTSGAGGWNVEVAWGNARISAGH
jgi:hypothetical protein